MNTAATLNILVNARTGQATAALRKTQGQLKQTDRAAAKTSKGFKGLSSNAKFAIGSAAGAGLLGLGAAAKSSVGAFREQQRVTRLTEAVLKSTGRAANVTAKQVGELANQLAKKTGIDDEAVQTSENLLLTFTKVRNETGKGNKIFDQSTTAILDMATAMNHGARPSTSQLHTATLQLGKALQDPIKGSTALKRVGVDLDESRKKQIKTLMEQGKQMEAQKIILGELTTEFGGAAAKTATATDKLKVTLDSVAESVGAQLVPFIDKAAAGFDRFITGMRNGTGAGGQFVTVLRNIGTAFMAVVGPLATVALDVGKLGFAFLQTKAGMVTLAAVLGGLAGRLAFLAGAWAVAKVMAFTSAIGGAITMIRTAIAITTTLRAAMTLLAASMVSTGIGAFIVAIGVVAGALMGMKTKTDSAVLSQTAFRDAILQTRQALDQYADASSRIKDAQLAHEGAVLGLRQAEANRDALLKSGTATAQQVKQAEHEVAVARNEVTRTTKESTRAQRDEGATKRKAIADAREQIATLRKNSGAIRNNISDLRALIRGEGGVKLSSEQLRKAKRALRTELGRGRVSTLALKQEQLRLAIATGASKDKVKGLRREISQLESKNIKVSATVEVVNNVTGAIKDAVADAFDFSGGTGGAKDYGTGASGTKGPVEATIGAIVNHQMETADWKKILGPALEGAMGAPGSAKGALGMYERLGHGMGLVTSSGFRPGDPGWHGKNRARDMAGDAGAMLRYARMMFSRFGSNLLELIHTPMGKAIKNGQAVAPYAKADHHDHVHVAAAKGAAIKSHRATSPTVLFGEEAPRHPEYYISTNPRDKKRSMGLLAHATQEIAGKRLAQFKTGGLLKGLNKVFPAHNLGQSGKQLSSAQVRGVAEAWGGLSPARALQADQITQGESSRHPGILGHDPGGTTGVGLWQITRGVQGALGKSWIDKRGGDRGMRNPKKNAEVMAIMSGKGSSWSNWYGTRYLGGLQRGVQSVFRGGATGAGPAEAAASPMSKRNRKILKRIPKRLKKIKGIGLSKKQEGWLKFLTNASANFGEWGSRAGQLSTDDRQGKVGGQDEAFWTKRQLESLFALRNTLIRYEQLIVKKRERMKKMIDRAKKFLRKLERHPRRNKPLIKAYKSKVIPALKKRRAGLNTRRGELLSSLEEVQGIASPMGLMAKLPPIGTLGGQIFAAQTRLRELGTKTTDVADSTTAAVDTESPDLLRQLLRDANLRTAVGQNEIANLPFAGSFAQGGIVPGRGPMAAVVHGGEAIGQPGNVSVQVFVHPNGDGADVYVNEKKVEAVVEKVTRNMARKVGRAPGARG